MTVFRGFIAIDIDASPKLIAFEKDISKTGADVKLVKPENIHITIKFLGNTNDNHIDVIEQAMRASVQNITPFSITLNGTGVFPNQKYIKVIWVGIINTTAIETIAKTIDTSLIPLGFPKEQRGFSAHLTVGRVKTARNKDQLLKIIEQYNNKEFSVQEIRSIFLKKSELTPQGPLYSILREVRL